ncbi:hypothetical protein LWI28_014269 [Acer negundo]|uniref:Copper transport protein n=1 Tax=Acer negundo TaxID=4023 RepID=A0AAD5NET4_ACENE|nr:hypothetical protein LWI28_014269 [Acer negundo]KAK4833908.1 hypothetical protein QYF36_013164 [Acer negundo]
MSHDGNGGMPNMTPGSMSGGGMNSSSSEMMMMHMSFYWGKDVTIFFTGWAEKSLVMYIVALLFIFLLGLAVEVLSVSPKLVTGSTARSNLKLAVFVQTCIYALRMGFAYLVMLSVMSYNLGVFIVAVAGHAAGFFLVKVRALAVANRAGHPMSSTMGVNNSKV